MNLYKGATIPPVKLFRNNGRLVNNNNKTLPPPLSVCLVFLSPLYITQCLYLCYYHVPLIVFQCLYWRSSYYVHKILSTSFLDQKAMRGPPYVSLSLSPFNINIFRRRRRLRNHDQRKGAGWFLVPPGSNHCTGWGSIVWWLTRSVYPELIHMTGYAGSRDYVGNL